MVELRDLSVFLMCTAYLVEFFLARYRESVAREAYKEQAKINAEYLEVQRELIKAMNKNSDGKS